MGHTGSLNFEGVHAGISHGPTFLTWVPSHVRRPHGFSVPPTRTDGQNWCGIGPGDQVGRFHVPNSVCMYRNGCQVVNTMVEEVVDAIRPDNTEIPDLAIVVDVKLLFEIEFHESTGRVSVCTEDDAN